MTLATKDALVSTEWLEDHMDAPDLRVVDASWYLPTESRNGLSEYRQAHIPGAVFFDVDDICDTESDFPHMMPTAQKFAARVRRLGLGDGNRIIAYDSGSGLAAPRLWWMFRAFGHREISVLDGGFAKWRAEDRPVEDLPAMPRERHFTARLNTTVVRDIGQMRENIETRAEQILDARSEGRFTGKAAEPRAGLRGGHMPGSLNLPFNRLMNPDDGAFLRGDALRQAFEAAGVDLDRPIVTTCGSGVTAAVLSLGLHLLGHTRNALYDGSWSEWAAHEDTPVETGAG
ncbi:MAG: 3-mercaptopyruvate sulfurtransferase [Sphingomonadales bacterium]